MWIIVKTKSGRERKRQMYFWRWTTVFPLYLLLPYMSRIKVSLTSPTTKQLYCLFFCPRANRTLSSCHYFHNGCKWRLYSCHLVLKIIYYLFNFIFFSYLILFGKGQWFLMPFTGLAAFFRREVSRWDIVTCCTAASFESGLMKKICWF